MSTNLPNGVVSALLTPFADDGTVDERALEQLVDFQVERGVDGFFVLGTSGEAFLMSADARRVAAERVLAAVADRAGSVIHCGASDASTTEALVRHAARLRPAAVAAMPPLLFGDDTAAFGRHYRAVAEAAGGTAVLAYENPARFGFTMGPRVIGSLVREIPALVGVKDSGDSLGRVTDYLAHEPDIVVYTGSNVLLLGALATGAAGAVASLANVVPELLVGVRDRFVAGDLEGARSQQLSVARLQRLVAGLPYVTALKGLAALRGLPSGRCQPPLTSVAADVVDELRRRLATDRELADLLTPVG